ncbi:MAG: hypothetical protein MUC87_03535 [Bacteroidia bacterium]|jgi:hypothetical protein|nr:hypothetical protein [Bacteroidia bacterium]
MLPALLVLAGGGALAAGYVSRLKRDADEIQVIVTGRLHSIKTDGVHVMLNVLLKNPTRSDFTFSYPFLTLLSQANATLGASQSDNSEIQLAAQSEQTLKPLEIVIPLGQVLSLGLEVFKALKDGKAGLQIQVKVICFARILFGTISKRREWLYPITLIKNSSDGNG